MSVANKKIFAVVGSSGTIGRTIVNELERLGHEVRPISRSTGVSIDDQDALDRGFAQVDGAYLMIPFDMEAPDLHRREADIGDKLAAAVARAKTRRVVLLSGLSAHLDDHHKGSALGAAMMERRLAQLQIPELVYLRVGFFMENLLQAILPIAQSGTFDGAFAGDRPMPMVASVDVGRRAAALLTAGSVGARVQELQGPRDYTLDEAVKILGEAIGRSDTRYVQRPYEEAQAAMVSVGISKSLAEAVMVTARGFNAGLQWATESRSSNNTTPTTLEKFAAETFAPLYCDAQRTESPNASAAW